MRNIKVKLDYIISNAVIEVYKKDHRRVIDKKDIDNYEKILIGNLNDNDVNPQIIANERIFTNISKYFCSVDGKFVLLPWISIEELISKYQDPMPDKVLECFSNDLLPMFLLKRTESELKEFDKVSESIRNLYLKEENDKIDSLEKEKQKCLLKIENIRKNSTKR